MFLGAILVITLVHEDFAQGASTAKRRCLVRSSIAVVAAPVSNADRRDLPDPVWGHIVARYSACSSRT